MAQARGGSCEERVAQLLAKHLRAGIVVLHDRAIPRSRANIDHIAIASSGVWVIDAKRYKGKVAVSKPIFGQPKLTIAGRDRTKLVEGVARQVAFVRDVAGAVAPHAHVRGALWFIDSELPLLGTLTFDGMPLLHPRQLAKRINAGGPLTAGGVAIIATVLADRFTCA